MGPFFRSCTSRGPNTDKRRRRRRRMNSTSRNRIIRKKTKPVGKVSTSAIKSLSGDLLIEVLARVGSSSFTDLYNAKLCCREFLGAVEDDYILQKVSMDKFPIIPWTPSDELISFLNRCKESGNPEALYRQGLIEYFSSLRTESGLENLKRAAEKGHAEASYVYGIILVCKGGQLKQEGLKLLNAVMSSKPRSLRIKECRRRIKSIIWRMWIHNKMVPQQLPSCNGTDCCIRKIQTWDPEDEEIDAMNCDACRWNHEVISFCNMLHRG
ncbi:putative F-box protein At1g67623 isoform X2 [Cornus florida]|uniref:putative F-box protein At1g67623 isoform X2 n=1 Tax=Cornus florida TaxID=4283 RepID=UPI00289CF09F|nr:putative F-box protein At1g67623 isoform X2 [Cornus florida]